MPGLLLDSHALYWLVSGEGTLSEGALVAIGESQEAGRLFVSPITAWELTIASRKPTHRNPPQLGEGTPEAWFRAAMKATGARIIAVHHRIACEAAAVAHETGHRDPGDCYLIATARIRRIPILSRDPVMHELAAAGFLHVIGC
ncbi:type II toxin-antitoxin system VapC family toxin [Elioraea rosea]|uniref:type II toxin-antitoxin system VapC family toxin n=1 Tax=Elioraea rosea TaxID=2492390 RepID=UPI001182B03B|nr:type II toxin-antitoxin system VapC family toxin [Elioraea rosea]